MRVRFIQTTLLAAPWHTQRYTYQVRSGAGGVDGAWSRPYTFRAPYGHGTAAKNGGSNMTRVVSNYVGQNSPMLLGIARAPAGAQTMPSSIRSVRCGADHSLFMLTRANIR